MLWHSGGGLAVRVTQQAESLMLKITEFQQLPLLLFGGEAGIKIPHRRKQGPEPGRASFRSASASSMLQETRPQMVSNRSAASLARVLMAVLWSPFSPACGSLSGPASPPCPEHKG